jgi:uncharacterized damage-inducible protein DinB
MYRTALNLSMAALLSTAGLSAQNPLTAEVKAAYDGIKSNIIKAAEKMPESAYDFKPTPDVRSFGQLVAHVADAQMGICSIAKGEMKRGEAASKTTKADLVAALKASDEVCDSVYAAMTDAESTVTVKAPGRERTKLGILNFNVTHDNEMYGIMGVYLRLKGIVPPSSEATASSAK